MLRVLATRNVGLARRGGVHCLRALLSQQPPVETDPSVVRARMEAEKQERALVVTPPQVRVVPDGLCSIPEEPSDVSSLDGMPDAQRERMVIISQHAKCAMTSATGKTKAWHITWENSERWSNPLMGWTSTADPMSNLDLQFDTAEQAVRFATKSGWAYDLKPPIDDEGVLGQNTYAHNFLPKAYENQIAKFGKKNKIFKRPKANASHYFRPLTYRGDAETRQHGPNRDEPWK